MLGILMLQTRFPRLPGDIGHPDTFDFPVRRRVVPGASPARVIRGCPGEANAALAQAELVQAFVEAGHGLVREGARALSTSCGFLARWQPELQAALPVPVWSSALLKLADLQGTRCGVITIEAASLTAEHLCAVGADPMTPVEGIRPGSRLHASLLQDLPTLDEPDAQRQVVDAGRRLLQRVPDLQAIVLECTNLPPYAQALEQDLGLPVHHIVSLLNERMARLSI